MNDPFNIIIPLRLQDVDENVALVRKSYEGTVILAEDLACVAPAR